MNDSCFSSTRLFQTHSSLIGIWDRIRSLFIREHGHSKAWGFYLAILFLGVTTSVLAENADLKLVDLVKSDVGICAEITGLENKINSLKSSPIVNRFCNSVIYQDWHSSREHKKIQKAREKVEAVTGLPIEEVITSLFGKRTIIAFFPEPEKWSALLLTEARDEETLKSLEKVWIETGSHEIEKLEFEGVSYFRRFKKGENGEERETAYYIRKDQYFALSDHESRIQDVIKIYILGDNSGTNTEEFRNLSLGYSADYLEARKAVSEDCFSTIYLNPERIDHLIGRHLKKSRDLSGLQQSWRDLKSGMLGIELDQTGFALNLALLKKENSSGSALTVSNSRMEGASEFLSKVPSSAILLFAGKIHLKNVEKLVTKIVQYIDDENLENIRQVSRGLLLGLDLFDDVLPSLRPDWGIYLIPKENPDIKTFPMNALASFGLPENDVIVKNGARISLNVAMDNGLNTGLNLLAAFYNSKKTGQPAVVRTEQTNAFIMRWVDSLWSYQPAYSIDPNELVLATHPEMIRNHVSNSNENRLINDPTLTGWIENYSEKENQWLILNLREVHSSFIKHHDYFIEHIMNEEHVSEEEAGKELQKLSSVSSTFDFFLLGLYGGQKETRILLGAACEKPADK